MIKILEFNELTNLELYEVLRLRSEVFVVEQNCIYQDLDNLDQEAVHLLYYNDEKIIAYLRILKSKTEVEEVRIGRVLIVDSQRRKGIASLILQEAIKYIEENLKIKSIHLSAQVYAMKLYENLGFKSYGESFLEDGIEHINMKKYI